MNAIDRLASKHREDSPAVFLLSVVWEFWGHKAPHSWARLNFSMSRALSLAINSGLEFYEEDFSVISERFCSGRWLGADRELFYSSAASSSPQSSWPNLSACRAWEKWVGRKPFMIQEAPSAKNRVYVGLHMAWEGQRVTVTSFSKDGKSFIACSYKEPPEGEPYTYKVQKRYRITQEMLKERNLKMFPKEEESGGCEEEEEAE